MTATFLLPLRHGRVRGAWAATCLTDAFGIVAMVAMTPLIIIQIIGLIYKVKTDGLRRRKAAPVPMEAEDEIISLSGGGKHDRMTSICGLITIVDRGKSAAVQRIYQAHHVSASLVLRGHGTANSEIMDMLGLDEPQKEVLLSVTHRSACADIFDDLRGQLHFDKPGTGYCLYVRFIGH